MVIVLIRRCIKPDMVKPFLEKYQREKPNHPGFICETLTKLRLENLPEPMRGLAYGIGCEGCVTYLNVAHWKSAEAFEDHFKPQTMYDPDIECSPRLRAVFEEVDLS